MRVFVLLRTGWRNDPEIRTSSFLALQPIKGSGLLNFIPPLSLWRATRLHLLTPNNLKSCSAFRAIPLLLPLPGRPVKNFLGILFGSYQINLPRFTTPNRSCSPYRSFNSGFNLILHIPTCLTGLNIFLRTFLF